MASQTKINHTEPWWRRQQDNKKTTIKYDRSNTKEIYGNLYSDVCVSKDTVISDGKSTSQLEIKQTLTVEINAIKFCPRFVRDTLIIYAVFVVPVSRYAFRYSSHKLACHRNVRVPYSLPIFLSLLRISNCWI